MNVSRDVILDLLPLYVAGEASPATRDLVETYLKSDPELAARVRALQAETVTALPAPAPPPELAMQSLRRTRRMLAWQRWLFGIGIALTAISFSLRIEFEGARPTSVHFFLLDHPLEVGPVFLLGIACLVAYYALRRRHRTGG